MPLDTDRYLEFITPKLGDPTYSVLKAHLLFEEIMNAFLARKLQHPEALKGSRLSFSQRLSIVRALASIEPDHWVYTGVEKINTIRNALAHEQSPKDIQNKISSYIDFVVSKSGLPLPQPDAVAASDASSILAAPGKHIYLAIDVATIGLYVEFNFQLNQIEPLRTLRNGI